MEEIICNISNSYIKFDINNNICYIVNININYNEFKLFVKLLVKFCEKLIEKNIKIISQLSDFNDYNSNKEFFDKFDKIIFKEKGVIELISNPNDFKFAVLRALNFQID